ncbi:hypothetical protein T492DRAFT_1051238 [Pavlovales sp. CCMP2436]|nr:hypothetical protein T492DRAFT_1051238 [Pavlovales sp. CCMP2436]|mmetsp:Transcript_27658/g.69685  ORF Transcript_27658/g.69685 Transcript_27658/m.69685 type:complete len:180 (+) Transcript_27658:105-644(+)
MRAAHPQFAGLVGLGLLAGASGWGLGQLSRSYALFSRLGRARARSLSDGAQAERAAGGMMEHVLFIECGFGNDQHGQNPTKAAVRACRNAIEFNSIPSIRKIVPGGYDNMKLRVQLGVPLEYHAQVDLQQVGAVFPYGQLLPVELVPGGLRASSGIALKEMGDTSDDMIIVVAHVTVGY